MRQYYMIKSFGIPESDISFYAGLTASAFSIAQFLTGIAWGRMSGTLIHPPRALDIALKNACRYYRKKAADSPWGSCLHSH